MIQRLGDGLGGTEGDEHAYGQSREEADNIYDRGPTRHRVAIVAGPLDHGAGLALHVINDEAGALQLLGRRGLGVTVQQIHGLHASADHRAVFLDESLGNVDVPVVLDDFDAVQSGAQSGVVGFGPRLAQELVDAVVAFTEAIQFGGRSGDQVGTERQSILHHLMANAFGGEVEFIGIADIFSGLMLAPSGAKAEDESPQHEKNQECKTQEQFAADFHSSIASRTVNSGSPRHADHVPAPGSNDAFLQPIRASNYTNSPSPHAFADVILCS